MKNKTKFNLQMFAGIDNFIPTVWSAEILLGLKNQLVFGALCNRDYQGDIKNYGDKVKINGVSKVTVKKYTKNTDIDAPETLEGTQQELVIDQGNYFNFYIDDVDQAQQNPKLMATVINEAVFELTEEADKYVADVLAKGVPTENTETADITDGNAFYEYLVKLSVKMSEANVPTEGRYVTVPPFMEGLLRLADKFITVDNIAVDARVNGQIGRMAGFNIVQSNNCSKTAEAYNCVAGHVMAATYGEQILNTKAYEPEKRFGTACKGLHVFGVKVTRPELLFKLVTNRPSTI